MSIITSEYKDWIGELKQQIRQSQIKAAVKVNTELLRLYWQLGGEIVAKQQNAQWGDGFLKQLSADLMAEFPEMKGFSLRNLERIRNWYLFYYEHYTITAQAVPQLGNANRQQLVGKIDAVKTKQPVSQLGNGIRAQVVPQLAETFFSVPWGHHILIMQRCKDMDKALFYIHKTVENNWSRSVLDWQIDSNLFEREGKAVSNFSLTLPKPQSDLAQQITKDPYIIDIMGVRQEMQERELEAHLDKHISQYLLELGKGFTYYGHQIQLKVGDETFYIDQLFYHVRLHCYVVVELKATAFKPEHVGQLNFYVNAVNALMRSEGDNPTIGLLICKDKNDVVAEYTLQGVNSPIGVSSMKIYDQLTFDYKSALPTTEEIEAEIKRMDE
jgi:predicted nuclease of restriction endonuclease-like (RecB) superfamily